jgi:hypothetical protein
LLATGDGPHEDRVCKGFADQFDGNSIYILSFKSPLFFQRITGLASLTVVRTYIDKFPINRVLWTCDKEHIIHNHWIRQVNDRLESTGISAKVSSEWKDAARLEVTLGPKNAVLWCALTGTTKNLEENLSQLIELELHENVAPDKKEIFFLLRRKGLKIEDLVKGASRENLRRATPSLFAVFEDIERHCAAAS